MRKLIFVPHKILTTHTEPVLKFDSKLKKLAIDMEELLVAQQDPPGVGLAGPQIGVGKAIFIMKPTPTSKTEVIINPEILETKISANGDMNLENPDNNTELEGCLSIPKIWSPIERAKSVKLKYQDLSGKITTKWFHGFRAVIVQHEVDHLQGVLFTQRAIEQKRKLYKEDGESLEPLKIG